MKDKEDTERGVYCVCGLWCGIFEIMINLWKLSMRKERNFFVFIYALCFWMQIRDEKDFKMKMIGNEGLIFVVNFRLEV